jgi:hypothetical protein
MFFKKKVEEITPPKPFWDESEIKKIVEASYFRVVTTSMTISNGFGSEGGDSRYNTSLSGLSTSGRFMPVEFDFDGTWEDQDFGKWSIYTCNSEDEHPFPKLVINLHDPDIKIRMAILDAHKAALLSGRRGAALRIHKVKDDGEGFVDGGYFSLTGIRIWADYTKSDLEEWAYPDNDLRFKWEGKPKTFWGD